MEVDSPLEMLTLVIVLVVLSPPMLSLTTKLYKNDFGGFDTQIEKTALKTRGVIIPNKMKLDKDDILLSLLIADKYTPKPEYIQFCENGNIIKIDDNFVFKKNELLYNAYTQLPYSSDLNYYLYTDNRGLKKWVIK